LFEPIQEAQNETAVYLIKARMPLPIETFWRKTKKIGQARKPSYIKTTYFGEDSQPFYKEQFPNVQIFETDPTSAEMCKYMSNCLLATKVSFANEMYDLCDKLGINYNKVKEMVIADKRIGKTHLDVTPERGFGGKCFPKDINLRITKEPLPKIKEFFDEHNITQS